METHAWCTNIQPKSATGLRRDFLFLPQTTSMLFSLGSFALEDFLEAVFSKVDVLHTPLLPIPTPTLEQTTYSDGPNYLKMVVALTRNTKVINFLGLPALSVTCGYTSDGMPTSFQLVGRPFSESLLFRLGHRYQIETKLYRDLPHELCARVIKSSETTATRS